MLFQSLWFFIWALLWSFFFVLDGFDLGLGILYPFLGNTENDKKKLLNTIYPFWNGNEVWLVAAAGVTFAAFPLFYSAMFSCFYLPLTFIVFSLIFRGAFLEFRNKLDENIYKKTWDVIFFISSCISTLLFGVVFGNLFKGILMFQDYSCKGNFFHLLNFYSILVGITFFCMFILHGALWISLKNYGDLKIRVEKMLEKLWNLLFIFFIVFLMSSFFFTNLYKNYLKYPVLFLFILFMFINLFLLKKKLKVKKYFAAWIFSSLFIVNFVFFGVVGMYPNLLISLVDLSYSINIYNSSSSYLTLKIMLIVLIVFVPVIIGYQLWVYKLFSKKGNKFFKNY